MSGTRDVGWDDEDTRRAVARYRWASVGWVVTGATLLVIAVLVSSTMQARSDEIERAGVPVSGTVVDISGGLLSEGTVEVTFQWAGEEQRRTIQLDSSSRRYRVGEVVTVLVDPNDPSAIRTTEEDNDPLWAVWVFVVTFSGGVGGVTAGTVMLRRSRRWRKLLRGHAWRRVTYDYADVPAGRSVQPIVAIEDRRGRVVLGVRSCLKRRLRRLRAGSRMYVAGTSDGTMVATPEPGGPLFELGRARRDRTQRRWEAVFDDAVET